MNKKDFWPAEGNLKKGLIILTIILLGSLFFTLLEEKTSFKISKRTPLVIALACLSVWFYQIENKKEEAS